MSDNHKTKSNVAGVYNTNVYHPAHYNQGNIEAFDVMDAFGLNDFYLGNAVKYLLRCKLKGNEVEDLEKCIFYIQKHLEIIKTREV